jgi:hypothetical protein
MNRRHREIGRAEKSGDSGALPVLRFQSGDGFTHAALTQISRREVTCQSLLSGHGRSVNRIWREHFRQWSPFFKDASASAWVWLNRAASVGMVIGSR